MQVSAQALLSRPITECGRGHSQVFRPDAEEGQEANSNFCVARQDGPIRFIGTSRGRVLCATNPFHVRVSSSGFRLCNTHLNITAGYITAAAGQVLSQNVPADGGGILLAVLGNSTVRLMLVC